MSSTLVRFEVGKNYAVRSVCDSECVWQFKVVSRTAATVTLDGHNGTARRGIKIVDGEEICYPLGNYSMCPVARATRQL
jgi:hypothetical protein